MKNFKIHICILILAAGVSVSCSKHAVDFEAEPVKKDFGPLIPDKVVNLQRVTGNLKPVDLPKDKVFSVSSEEWFDLANELLEGDSALAPMGQNLIDSFYKLSGSHTTMTGTLNPPGSPFAEAAYWFAKPMMTKAYDDSLLLAESKVISLSKNIVLQLNDLEKYPPPEILLERMIQGLNKFKEDLAGQNQGDQVIDAITSDIDKKFAPDLIDMKRSATFDPKVPLIVSLKNLEGSLAKLPELSDFDRQHLLIQVRIAIALTERCDLIKNSDQALSFLIDVWLAKDMRKNYPSKLKNLFESLSESEIFSLATLNKPQIIDDSKWLSVKGESDTLILQDSSLIALYLKNNGQLLPGKDTWESFQKNLSDYNNLLATPEIKYLAKLVANLPSDDPNEQRSSLISSWLGVPYRLGIPTDIREVFSPLSEQDLELIRNNTYLVLFARLDSSVARLRYGLIDALDKRGVDYVKQLFSETIISAIRERLDLALIPIAKDYSNQVSNTIVQALEKRRGDAESVTKVSYNDFGRYYLGKLIFGVDSLKKDDSQGEVRDNALIEKNTLPLIEKSFVNFAFQQNQWKAVESPAETNPSVLGLSLGVVENRILRDPQDAVAIEYQTISKLLAIAGYHDPKDNLTESFMTSMTSSHLTQLFSVASYDPTYTVFAVPENIKIKENYKMSEGSRANPQVTVMGQMKLLYGYAKLMKFFKPWLPSTYDSGLGAIRIDEDKEMIPFNRKDYFLLSTGLGAYILKSIPLKMLGLISKDHKFIDGTKVENPAQFPAIAATLSDFTLGGMNHVVTVASMASAIIGMSAFYEQIKDLQKSSDPTIQSNIKDGALGSSQENLQNIISGLVLFATGQLKSDDGGFVHSYDLDKMAPLPGDRILSDQLLMEEALLAAGETLQSGFMISRAMENLFFLNSHFWNESLGFYRETENDLGGRVSLLNVARAIHNINVFRAQNDLTRSPNDSSLIQMRQLRELWINRFFGQKTQDLPPISQVSEFSL